MSELSTYAVLSEAGIQRQARGVAMVLGVAVRHEPGTVRVDPAV
jgi:hypothetical protein